MYTRNALLGKQLVCVCVSVCILKVEKERKSLSIPLGKILHKIHTVLFMSCEFQKQNKLCLKVGFGCSHSFP